MPGCPAPASTTSPSNSDRERKPLMRRLLLALVSTAAGLAAVLSFKTQGSAATSGAAAAPETGTQASSSAPASTGSAGSGSAGAASGSGSTSAGSKSSSAGT